MLWIDGAGGFLVLPGVDWSIGGPSGEGEVELCIQGDLARRQACLIRKEGDYILQPLGSVGLRRAGEEFTSGVRASDPRASGQAGAAGPGGEPFPPLRRPVLLRSGDVLGVGGGVELAFGKPSPLSATARLDLISRHRTRPRADAVILMADTLVIGPADDSHIVVPWSERPLVLRRREGVWWGHAAGAIEVGGRLGRGRVALPSATRIAAEQIVMTLESL